MKKFLLIMLPVLLVLSYLPSSGQAQKQAQLNKALFAAVDAGKIETVKKLLAQGASPNASQLSKPGHEPKPGEYTGEDIGEPTYVNTQMPVLIRAIINSNRAIVELLIAKGANINARTSNNHTALIWAIGENDKKMIDLLLSRKADVKVIGTDGMTALDLAAHNWTLTQEPYYRTLYQRLQRAGAKR